MPEQPPQKTTELPNTGRARVRVISVNSLTAGERVHDVKARLLPRAEGQKPVVLRVRDELCERAPRAGDRLSLTMMAGQVAGVQFLQAKKRAGAAGDEGGAGA